MPWVGLRRLGLVAAPLVDQRLVGPAFGDLAVELDRRVEVGEGIFLVVHREIGEAAAVVGFRRVGDSEIEVEKSSIAKACWPWL